MTRTSRHVSRALIAILILVIAIGAIVSLNKSPSAAPHSPAVASAKAPPTTVPAAQPATQPTDPKLLMNSTEEATATKPAEAATPDLAARGFAKRDAGDLLTARDLLNQAIQSNSLSDADLQKCRDGLGEINQTLIFSSKRFADDEYGGTYTVPSGGVLQKIADQYDVTWELLCRINNLADPKKLRAAATIKVIKGPFHAVVTKHTFTLDIYVAAPPGEKGSMFVMSFPVGLGRDDSTPSGTWLVEPHKKLKEPTYYSPRGEGVIAAGDPKNPLGHRWIGITGIDGHAIGKLSYGIHGTIDPDSIGKQSSMGCIRMKNEDVERVYELLVEGKSQVVVRD